MKKLVIIFLTFSCMSAMADQRNSKIITATGEKEITMGTILNPFGGALKSARKIAKKNLIEKCNNELNGEIVGEITFETIRFDEGIMAAIVDATGECQF